MESKIEPSNILEMISREPSTSIIHAAKSLKDASNSLISLENFKKNCTFPNEQQQENYYNCLRSGVSKEKVSVTFEAEIPFGTMKNDIKWKKSEVTISIPVPQGVLEKGDRITISKDLITNISNEIRYTSHSPNMNARAAILSYIPYALMAGYDLEQQNVREKMAGFLIETATNPFDKADTNGTQMGNTQANFGLLQTKNNTYYEDSEPKKTSGYEQNKNFRKSLARLSIEQLEKIQKEQSESTVRNPNEESMVKYEIGHRSGGHKGIKLKDSNTNKNNQDPKNKCCK